MQQVSRHFLWPYALQREVDEIMRSWSRLQRLRHVVVVVRPGNHEAKRGRQGRNTCFSYLDLRILLPGLSLGSALEARHGDSNFLEKEV